MNEAANQIISQTKKDKKALAKLLSTKSNTKQLLRSNIAAIILLFYLFLSVEWSCRRLLPSSGAGALFNSPLLHYTVLSSITGLNNTTIH
jgi:hypothetical protein